MTRGYGLNSVPLRLAARLASPAKSQLPVVGGVLLVGVLYYLGARLGFSLAATPVPISMLWVPNALLLGVFLVAPPPLWPLIVLAVVPAHLAAELQSGVPLAMALAWLLTNCFEALLGAAAIRAVLGRELRFDSLRDVSVFIALGALLSPFVSSLFDAAHVRWIGAELWGRVDYWELVRQRTHANALSALVVVPFIVTWMTGARELRGASAARLAELALLLAGLGAVSAYAFLSVHANGHGSFALAYAPLPFLLWAAVRFGPLGVSSANALLAGAAVWGAVYGLGPFLGGPPAENAREVQLFLVAVSVPLILLAAALAERKRMEREAREQLNQLTHLSRVAMLGGLSGALAHELNQPLTAILSNAQAAQHLLAAGKLNVKELSDILSDIVAADARARDVITKLRALFQKGDVHLEMLDPNEVVEDVLEIGKSDFITREVTVITDLEPGLPPIQCDRVQLQQVLLNLAVNACEAMAALPGRRLMTIRTRAVGNGSVQISVVDRGSGLTDEARSRLFQPFYTSKAQGLGLGLYISRSIVAAHGGRLEAASMAAGGTAFHVVLPSVPAAAHALSSHSAIHSGLLQ
jgi:signal transduction histidine kinase